MQDYLTEFNDWLTSLGEEYDVDPLTLGILYFISKPCFIGCLVLTVNRARKKAPVLVPILFSALAFSIPYVYIIVAGRNIPAWVYIFIACMFVYGAYTIRKKLREKPVLSKDVNDNDV
ncbi:hypothetical protein LJ707_00765 [Mucilaginibacter sp. UR6-1]|uniref:hypothetical protein n=1 Tax=Mucilaginibacter sp. UR6-1 TaxID=1435643 RepID=UPI001E38AFEF|nr:hypothetical protein [Mucilaginibacter sp. UR6-1]MCC8407444.1 hypothetical protein [Mucilaginibacter sp. UR6-1]